MMSVRDRFQDWMQTQTLTHHSSRMVREIDDDDVCCDDGEVVMCLNGNGLVVAVVVVFVDGDVGLVVNGGDDGGFDEG